MKSKGLDPDTVPLKTARLVEQRDLSRWLPLALASLYCLVCAYGAKNPPKVSDILRRWGLSLDADTIQALTEQYDEQVTDNALRRFFGGD